MHVLTFNKPNRNTFVLLAAGVLCFSHLTFAAVVEEVKAVEPNSEAEPVGDFKKLDVNSDGKLVEKEVVSDQLLATKFKFADTDGDGGINASEYEKFKKLVYLK